MIATTENSNTPAWENEQLASNHLFSLTALFLRCTFKNAIHYCFEEIDTHA